MKKISQYFKNILLDYNYPENKINLNFISNQAPCFIVKTFKKYYTLIK